MVGQFINIWEVLKEIKSNLALLVSPPTTAVNTAVPENVHFPMHSMVQFDQLDSKLESKELFDALVSQLQHVLRYLKFLY